MYWLVLYWLDLLDLLRLLDLLDLLGLLALLPLTVSAGMDSRIKASIIPAWFILISLKVDFYQLHYTAKVQKSQLRRRTKNRVFRWDEWPGPRGDAHIAPRPCGRERQDELYRPTAQASDLPGGCGHPPLRGRWGVSQKKPGCVFCSRGKIYPCFFRFSELLARTAEVIWMKSLTYFFTFSPLR